VRFTLSSAQTQFQNENMTVDLKRDPGCLIRLDISLSPLATQAAYQKALKTVNKEVSIPGFRKGKAPQTLILKNYSQHVDREWRELLLNTAFGEA
jgi:trigger factor